MVIETVARALAVERRRSLRRKRSEDGAIAIMTAIVIIVMVAMFGLALDLSRSYNRKVELQSVVDAGALAAAAALNGTNEGIDKAVDEAELAAVSNTFSYDNSGVISWSNAALTFCTRPDCGPGEWMNAETAKANASKIFFARVDTSVLDSSPGKVQNFLMPILSSRLAETDVTASAVAGRDSLDVLPLAICANSNTSVLTPPPPSGELVEYGFRRGISYDLMKLNPNGRSPENFLVNPVAPPGTVGTSMMNRMDMVAPFICTGKMAIPTLKGGDVTVERGFPIDKLYVFLNSRFGTYGTSSNSCVPSTAPADPSTKSFDLASVTWMKEKPDGLSANQLADPEPLLTVAENPTGATKKAYGPLWSYAKAAKHSSYLAYGGKEPPGGYATFSATAADWGLLYNPGKPEPQSYTSTPYLANGGMAPYKPYRNTRVLRIPLLRCPVSTELKTTAEVAGIAKFFMTVPASSSALYAEFAGMDNETASGGNVRLYR